MFKVRCRIERGGFSGERTFEVTLPDGKRLVGAADIQYLCDAGGNPLPDDQPPAGTVLEGFVNCRLVRWGDDDQVLVEFPSTDLMRVPEDELIEAVCA